MVKMTFTFDEQTADTLRRAALRLKKPQSAVVREAIQDYASRVKRARGREIDIAIAACAVVHTAHLWTLNPADFEDIPDLKVL